MKAAVTEGRETEHLVFSLTSSNAAWLGRFVANGALRAAVDARCITRTHVPDIAIDRA